MHFNPLVIVHGALPPAARQPSNKTAGSVIRPLTVRRLFSGLDLNLSNPTASSKPYPEMRLTNIPANTAAAHTHKFRTRCFS